VHLFNEGGRRGAFAVVCLGLALCRAEAVSASTFRVSPVQVTLSQAQPSALLTLGNDSDEELRFQISAFTWDQDAQGHMQLTPTQDVVFFPMMLTLGAGQERKIRVGSTAQTGPTEKTYRIFVEELPSATVNQARTAGTQIRVMTKMGIPIFVQPAQPRTDPTIEALGVTGDRLRFVVRNAGNAHFILQNVHMVGTGADGTNVLDRNAEGWYVLAGGARAYEQVLTNDECRHLTSIAIEAQTDRGPLTTKLDLPAPACEPAATNQAALAAD